MKITIAFIILAVLASAESVALKEGHESTGSQITTPDSVDFKQNYVKECAEELKISDETVKEYSSTSPNKSVPPNGNYQCALKCFLKKLDFFNEESGFNLKQIKSKILESPMPVPSDEIDAVLEKCNKEAQGADNCERVYKGIMCFSLEESRLRWGII